MTYNLVISENAKRDIELHKKSGNQPLYRKLVVLLNELIEHPYTGAGKPECLIGDLSGFWSRRINREHRLIYSVFETTVTVEIISAKGHYS